MKPHDRKISIKDAHDLMSCPYKEDAEKWNKNKDLFDSYKKIMGTGSDAWVQTLQIVERLKKRIKEIENAETYDIPTNDVGDNNIVNVGQLKFSSDPLPTELDSLKKILGDGK